MDNTNIRIQTLSEFDNYVADVISDTIKDIRHIRIQIG